MASRGPYSLWHVFAEETHMAKVPNPCIHQSAQHSFQHIRYPRVHSFLHSFQIKLLHDFQLWDPRIQQQFSWTVFRKLFSVYRPRPSYDFSMLSYHVMIIWHSAYHSENDKTVRNCKWTEHELRVKDTNSRISEHVKLRNDTWLSENSNIISNSNRSDQNSSVYAFSLSSVRQVWPSGLLFTLGCLRILIYVFYDWVWGSIRSAKVCLSELLPVGVCSVWGVVESFEKGWFRVWGYEVLTGWFYHSLPTFLSLAGRLLGAGRRSLLLFGI